MPTIMASYSGMLTQAYTCFWYSHQYSCWETITRRVPPTSPRCGRVQPCRSRCKNQPSHLPCLLNIMIDFSRLDANYCRLTEYISRSIPNVEVPVLSCARLHWRINVQLWENQESLISRLGQCTGPATTKHRKGACENYTQVSRLYGTSTEERSEIHWKGYLCKQNIARF